MLRFGNKLKKLIKIILLIKLVIALSVIVWTLHKQNQALETEYQVIQQLRAENENLVLINDLLIKKLKRCHQLNVNNSTDSNNFSLPHLLMLYQTNSFSPNMFGYMQ